MGVESVASRLLDDGLSWVLLLPCGGIIAAESPSDVDGTPDAAFKTDTDSGRWLIAQSDVGADALYDVLGVLIERQVSPVSIEDDGVLILEMSPVKPVCIGCFRGVS